MQDVLILSYVLATRSSTTQVQLNSTTINGVVSVMSSHNWADSMFYKTPLSWWSRALQAGSLMPLALRLPHTFQTKTQFTNTSLIKHKDESDNFCWLYLYMGWEIKGIYIKEIIYCSSLEEGVGWLCGSVVGSWPGGEFHPGSRQLLGERGSTLVNPSTTLWYIDD